MGKPVTALIGFVILVLGIGLAGWLVANRPKAIPRERPKSTPIVDVVKMNPTRIQVRIQAMGTVLPVDETAVQAEVSGRIEWVNPDLVAGGYIKKDTVLVKIDNRDYKLAVDRQKAALEAARSDLKIEQGRQEVAAAEWEFMKDHGSEQPDNKNELALRQPQLKTAEASVESARAAVKQAELDLERTVIRAPFDAVVAEETADVGDRASPGTVLTRLIGTHAFWIEASVRTDQLKWLSFPGEGVEQGSTVMIYPPAGGERTGKLARLVPELDPTGRMARVIIIVEDPLLIQPHGDAERPLLLNEFAKVEILGAWADGVVRVPRTALREGTGLWLLDADNRLRIVPAQILWGDDDEVFVTDGFDPKSRLIVSGLAAPVEGMTLSAEGDEPAAPARDGN